MIPRNKTCLDALRDMPNGNYNVHIDPDDGGSINVFCSRDGKQGI